MVVKVTVADLLYHLPPDLLEDIYRQLDAERIKGNDPEGVITALRDMAGDQIDNILGAGSLEEMLLEVKK